MKEKFASTLLGFLKNADKCNPTEPLTTRAISVFTKEGDDWTTRIKTINNRRFLVKDESYKKSIQGTDGIEECLDILDKVLVSRKYMCQEKLETRKTGEELRLMNRRDNRYQLFRFVIDSKDLIEENPSVTFEDICRNKAEELFSNEIHLEFRALLLGLESKDINEFKIGTHSIRKLTVEEKLNMQNNFEYGIGRVEPYIIATGYDDFMPSSFWVDGKILVKDERERQGVFTYSPKIAIKKAEEELELLLKTFRLYNSSEVGIRDFFVKISYTSTDYGCNKWKSERYNYGDFGKMTKIISGHFSRKFFQNPHYKYTENDVVGINDTLIMLKNYYSNPQVHITNAIEKFCYSFEQNQGVYMFSDLMVALEILINKPIKQLDVDKAETLLKLDKAKINIEKATTENEIKRELFNLSPYKGISSSIKTASLIISSKSEDQKEFYNFFQSNENDHCYTLRNDLFHGNISDEIITRIIKFLPQLSNYVRTLITILIQKKLDGSFVCNDTNYYDKLNELVSH